MKNALVIVVLFIKLTVLVGMAAWVNSILFALVYAISPYQYDFSDNIVTAGMTVVVALIGWVITRQSFPQ